MLPPRNNDYSNGRDKGLRSQVHRRFVRSRLCVAWHLGGCFGPVEAAHCRDIAPRGHGGSKPDDVWTVSMCRKHHQEAEKRELDWSAETGIDVRAMCLEFAAASPDRAIREKAKEYVKAGPEGA